MRTTDAREVTSAETRTVASVIGGSAPHGAPGGRMTSTNPARTAEKVAEVLKREHLRDEERRPLLVVLTDGRPTAGSDPMVAAARLRGLGPASFVVDTEEGYVRLGMAGELAGALGARLLRLEELRADSLVDLVERRRVA